MIINKDTYFVANNEALPVDKLDAILTAYITKHEPIIATKLLGYQLYKDFEAGINESVPAQKWLDLRDGADYTCNGVLYPFKGLGIVIADYVYYRYTKENQTDTVVFGMKRLLSENSEPADSSYKQAIALNEISEINNFQLVNYIPAINAATPDTYENYIPVIYEPVTHYGF